MSQERPVPREATATLPPSRSASLGPAMRRRLLPPDPWGLSPSSQARLARQSGERANMEATAIKPTENANQGDTMSDDTTKRRRRVATTVDGMFTQAPAQVTAPVPVEAVSTESDDTGPKLSASFAAITETVFELADPMTEYEVLEKALKLDDALAPAVLQAALNDAEDNARRAHRLYVIARADYERFESESRPVIEGMRDAANRELQAEKDNKQRSKAITEDDVIGRASVLFPDEWRSVHNRHVKAEGMLDHLKVLANLWAQRCYSLSTMLNAGKRS